MPTTHGDGAQHLDPMQGVVPGVQQEIRRFTARLRRQQVTDALDVARKTLEIMRMVVSTAARDTVSALLDVIRRVGVVLVAAKPHELVIGNMVRRILSIVREESAGEANKGAASAPSASAKAKGLAGAPELGRAPSLINLLDGPGTPDYALHSAKSLKGPIIEVVNELIDELASVSTHIAEQALEHMHTVKAMSMAWARRGSCRSGATARPNTGRRSSTSTRRR